MHVNAYKQLLKSCIEKDVKIPFLVVGTMGIGKSQVHAQVAQELSTPEKPFQIIDLRLAQQEPGDLIGLPRSNKETGKTTWLKPEWWPEEGTRGILFLDEVNRAPVDVRQAVFQLVLDRKLHTHQLPNGWYVHAAMNPDNGAYQTEQLDQAMVRRFCVIKLAADLEDWSKFWYKRYEGDEKAEFIARFVMAHKKLLVLQEEFDIESKPTPDSYRMAYELWSSGAIPDNLQAEVFRGVIGNEASIAFIRFLDKKFVKPISGKEILANYGKVKEAVLAQSNDANYVTLHDLIGIISDGKNVNKAQLDNLAAFLLDAPAESQATLIVKMPDNLIGKLSTYKDLVQKIKEVLERLGSKK